MNSKAARRFWKCYSGLPEPVRQLAAKNYPLWCDNPSHPSLDFKNLGGGGGRFSVRVGDHYRALGHTIGGGVEWVWIGTREEYNKLVH
ncbi:MAG: hypothetical protein KGR98_11960 [Verrucomicrobia bacterium]|nr:hypothetical protein [Verrucomicrobiota bacterium]MDE3097847.1 hypothetical protein [Verrucomicrobiota bacterium]